MKTQEELKQLKVEYETMTNKLKELTEDELILVTGGVGEREITIIVTVTLPSGGLEDYILKVCIDGVYQEHMTQTVNSIVGKIDISFKGVSGHKIVHINLNDSLYKTYDLNFDNKSYIEI